VRTGGSLSAVSFPALEIKPRSMATATAWVRVRESSFRIPVFTYVRTVWGLM
jgi:hypothetical protein